MNYPTIYPTRKQHRQRKNEKKRISEQRSNLYRQRGNPVRRPLIKGFPVPWKNRVACKASERAQKFAYAAHRIDDIITVIDVTSAKVETPVFLEDRFTSFFSFHPSSVEPFFSLSFSLSLYLSLSSLSLYEFFMALLERQNVASQVDERGRIVCFEFEKWRRAAYL